MNILAIDASGIAGSVAYLKSGKLVGEYYICDQLTHSQTIMPMLEDLKAILKFDLEEVDAVAVTSGPGSFTGIRIGVTAAKTLALALEVPIIGVPTLDVMAHCMSYTDYLICPIMDARRQQVYTALYEWQEDELVRITDHLATDLRSYVEALKIRNRKVIFIGDGVEVYRDVLEEVLGELWVAAPSFMRMQRASVLAHIAEAEGERGNTQDPSLFVPMYLRKSQAEREKEEREKNER